MADVQTGFYPQAPTNGFGAMTPAGIVGLVQGINTNKLFQQTFDARQGVADAYKNNVGPDGTIDQPGLVRDLANSGFNAGEALHQGTANEAARFDLLAKQHNAVRDLFGSLADKPDLSKADLYSTAAKAAKMGIDPQIIRSYLADAPTKGGALRSYVTTLGNQAQGASSTSGGEAGPPGPTSAPTTVTHGAANYMRRGIGVQPENAPGMATGLPPGTPESMQGAAHMYNEATAAAGKYGQRVNPLRQAIPILEHMKETDIGPVSERWNDLKSAAVNLGAGPLLGIDPEKIRDANELKKYFGQYSLQAGATLGPHTNDGMAAAVTSNPNMKMDKLSATELSKVAFGIERMQQAGVLEFNDLVSRGKKQPSDFGKFMVDWGTQQDPRSFVYDLMTKEQQAKVKKSMPPDEAKKMRDTMNMADRHGLLGDVHFPKDTKGHSIP